jgi:hypothetical protein
MYHNSSLNQSIHALLKHIDEELSEEIKKTPCAFCGGQLNQANYPRSPLGLASSSRGYYELRYALCCGKCRRRTAIPSVRFFGRYRFVAPIFLLISLLKRRVTRKVISQVKRHFGILISLRTWKRWRHWWLKHFGSSSFWKQAKGIVPSYCAEGPFPRSLLSAFSGGFNERWVVFLQFLSPLSAGIYRAV